MFGARRRAARGIQDNGYGLVAGRAAPLENEGFYALGDGHQPQAQGCGAGMHGLGLRTQQHEKRVALLSHEMQAAQAGRMRSAGPAKQGGAGIVFQDLLGRPQGVALGLGVDP